MSHAIIYDCEFLTDEGAPSRYWNGPFDPDPVIAQIGAVKLDLLGSFEILDTLTLHVTPQDRNGGNSAISPFFSRLTGISEEVLASRGTDLADALVRLDEFSEGVRLWSWGKDELNMVAISCWIAGIAPPFRPGRFGNACSLMLKAGMSYEVVKTTRSTTLAERLGVETPALKAHDALADALGVAYSVQTMLRRSALLSADFD